MIDAVLSYHLNPLTCGVAKFNHELARRLGVPCDSVFRHQRYRHPLISVKPSEMPQSHIVWRHGPFDLLLHSREGMVTFASQADRVLYADEVGCPPTIAGDPTRGAYRVLAFGMAHKLLLPHFERLKAELDREHPDYTLELSTAVHEGSPWDETLEQSTAAMRAIFGDKLRVLGLLADDALAKELQEVDAVALFYEPALRANNTTAWAALSAGKKLYTNTDEQSPPLDPTRYTWDRLIEMLRAEVPA